ncbi:protein NPGR2-like [Tasmannia lanceolata]|uniref:protein NPGR2-like n=1 Tax=Tasmannia lanceolata TaxID=3420 RepID=UPI004064020E
MRGRKWMKGRGMKFKLRFGKIMKCLCSGEQLKADEMVPSSESLATRDYSATASGYSSRTAEGERRADTGNIEEAESSLRDGGCLNYEEARALLGRLEYQRGNVEAALRVFDGIDIAAITPKMKLSIAKIGEHGERRRRRSNSYAAPPMSIHAVSLLLEAIYLKAKSLQDLGRFNEAAQSCKVILDTVESALPDGLPENFHTESKLKETLNKAIELLPELWKQTGFFHEAILSYRRALLSQWNIDSQTTAEIQKKFAILLLYGGCDASPPNLRSQTEGSFIPKNNIEEAVLLLLILLRKFALKRIEWDPSIIDHLIFALSVSGELKALANQVEGLLPGNLDRRERYYTLALCYFGEGDDLVALNLLRKLLSSRENPNCIDALILASKICGDHTNYAEEGVCFSRRALANLHGGCDQMKSVANCLLGISLSAEARSALSDSERINRQSEALGALETAEKLMRERDSKVIFHLSLENAEQRKLDVALDYAKHLLKLEGGSNIRGWILLARILSAQKQFSDAEIIINAALDQTGKWDHGALLRTKAKLQIAQGQLKNAVETYTQLLAVLQVRSKSFAVGKKLLKGGNDDKNLEIETWHDLAYVYTSMSQWRDAEICLSKSKAISPHSASRWHATGVMYEAKGLYKEALGAFKNALEVDPTHVPSLVSTATVLIQLGDRTSAVVRSFLTDALRLDRTNHCAWFNLGLVFKAGGGRSALEASECFQAAALLEESAPVEPFR